MASYDGHCNQNADATYSVDDALNAAGLGRFQYSIVTLTGLLWSADGLELLMLSFIKGPLQ